MRKAIVFAVLATGLLAACAREETPEGVIPEGYKNAMDKAQGVEDKLQDSLNMTGEKVEE